MGSVGTAVSGARAGTSSDSSLGWDIYERLRRAAARIVGRVPYDQLDHPRQWSREFPSPPLQLRMSPPSVDEIATGSIRRYTVGTDLEMEWWRVTTHGTD